MASENALDALGGKRSPRIGYVEGVICQYDLDAPWRTLQCIRCVLQQLEDLFPAVSAFRGSQLNFRILLDPLRVGAIDLEARLRLLVDEPSNDSRRCRPLAHWRLPDPHRAWSV